MTTLPTPSAVDKIHSQKLALVIQKNIESSGGWISFEKFMQLALYASSLGYYAAGSQKFGHFKNGGGDFVTAPQISPLFAHTISKQIAQVLLLTQGSVLELGAGTGKLAADILLKLADLDALPIRYLILEVSDHLRQVQIETMSEFLPKEILDLVEWINVLPTSFCGVIFGNELLDAIPVSIVHKKADGIYERGVVVSGEMFDWQDKLLIESSLLDVTTQLSLPDDYITEVGLAASGLIATLANIFQKGVILMIDYGFSELEYYHPQRNQGTLMCHYQHYAHSDPIINVGLQDITAHVNFTSIAHAGVNHGLELSGFCSQAQFLINCGILEEILQVSPNDITSYAPLAAAAQKLLSPAEMGDLFKVIAFSKNIDESLIGFVSGDKSYSL